MEVKQTYLKTHINPINDVSKVKDDMKGLALSLIHILSKYIVTINCKIITVCLLFLPSSILNLFVVFLEDFF